MVTHVSCDYPDLQVNGIMVNEYTGADVTTRVHEEQWLHQMLTINAPTTTTAAVGGEGDHLAGGNGLEGKAVGAGRQIPGQAQHREQPQQQQQGLQQQIQQQRVQKQPP